MNKEFFEVRNESLMDFFGIYKKREIIFDLSEYGIGRDDIIVKKRPELIPGNKVVFIIEDEGRRSRNKFSVHYIYDICVYDDISLRLQLNNISNGLANAT